MFFKDKERILFTIIEGLTSYPPGQEQEKSVDRICVMVLVVIF